MNKNVDFMKIFNGNLLKLHNKALKLVNSSNYIKQNAKIFLNYQESDNKYCPINPIMPSAEFLNKSFKTDILVATIFYRQKAILQLKIIYNPNEEWHHRIMAQK